MASPFLQGGVTKPALQGRKNGAATPRPPAPVGSFIASLSFPPPMRRHAACSGCLLSARTSLAGKRRAGAPGSHVATRGIDSEFGWRG